MVTQVSVPEFDFSDRIAHIANGTNIIFTGHEVISFDPSGNLLSNIPADYSTGTILNIDTRSKMKVLNDTALMFKSGSSFIVSSFTGDSLSFIANPEVEHPCPYTTELAGRGELTFLSTGNALHLNATTLTLRSPLNDTVWSTTIATAPLGLPCVLQNAAELQAGKFVVTGYTVVDSLVQGDVGWMISPWLGIISEQTGQLLDSMTVSSISTTSGTAWWSICRELLTTSDGGYAALFQYDTYLTLVKGDSTGSVVWTSDISQSPNNIYPIPSTFLSEFPDGSLSVVAHEGRFPMVAKFSTNGNLLCHLVLDSSVVDYSFITFDPPDYARYYAVGTENNAEGNVALSIVGLAEYASDGGLWVVLQDPCQWQSTEDHPLKQQPALYPRPCSGPLTVATDKPCIAELWDATGQVVLRKLLGKGQQQLDLSAQPNGVYVLRLRDESGKVSAQPVVVQH